MLLTPVSLLLRLVDFGPANRISRPPGKLLLDCSRVVFGMAACEQVFSQIVADMREEYFSARAREASWEARFAWGRGIVSFWCAVVKRTGLALLAKIGLKRLT
jgi:hypothetical protein